MGLGKERLEGRERTCKLLNGTSQGPACDLNSKSPEHLRAKLKALEAAGLLFGERGLRFCLTDSSEGDDGQTIPRSLKIVIDERLCFVFLSEPDGWVYDGWEVGDHSKDWLDDVIA